MNESRIIAISKTFRVLAGLVAFAAIMPFIVDPVGTIKNYANDIFDLVWFMLIVPLFIYCSVRGRVPDFISTRIDDETFDDISHAEKFFTEFSAKSIGFAVVGLLMIAYVTFKHSFN